MIKCRVCNRTGKSLTPQGYMAVCSTCKGKGVVDTNDLSLQQKAAFYGTSAGYDPSEVQRILQAKAATSLASGYDRLIEVERALNDKAQQSTSMLKTVTNPAAPTTTNIPSRRSVKPPTEEVQSSHSTATATTRRTNNMSETDDIRNARRNQDMILAPNEYALIRDDTKGEVSIYVGPNKTSLASSDFPVVLDPKTNRFKGVSLDAAIQAFLTAAEGSYIVLENPAKDDAHPQGQGKVSLTPLRTGKKVNISGPATFALWPGQSAKVLPGHNLRSNEYLLARVYDEEAARTNFSKAVMKTQTETPADNETSKRPNSKAAEGQARTSADIPTANELTMGKLFVIRGTEVSFYMPPTGIEVVPEHVNGEDRYIRLANTLERLEYCLLLDQNGSKRYVRGPAVVFPRPTETFVEAPIKSNPDKAKAKKFRAQELTPTSGIHIRVIADYTDDVTNQSYKEGQELFTTGGQTPVYFPREEHAIIKYGEQDVHYGIAIPAGEGRYALNRTTGEVPIVKGPQIFLPDPRTQVIAQRALPLNLVELLYPGNAEALEVNAARLGIDEQDIMGAGGANAAFLNSNYVRNTGEDENYGAVAAVATPDGGRGRILIKSASKSLPGDAFDRKSKFTAPRSVILNTKYDGPPTINLWTGYAMLLVRKSGERRVVQGPGTYMLEYDEIPQVVTLSTGKPKNMDKPRRDTYLKTTANMVSDIIDVETKDFCRINVKVSYRVNFEGEPEKWFAVDNYVKFLCDHMRSRIRSAVQRLGIEEFYSNHTPILRDIILGTSPGKGEVRHGTPFSENGMRIYDVEVLGIDMQNTEVEKLLIASSRSVIQNTLVIADERRKLAFVTETEDLKRQTELAKAETQRATLALQAETQRITMETQAETAHRKLDLDLVIISSNARQQAEQIAREGEATAARTALDLANERATAEIKALELTQLQARQDVERYHAQALQALELAKLAAQVQATVDKGKAIEPQFIAALQAFGDKALAEKLAEAMAPLAIIGGGKKSVADIFNELLKGTVLGSQLAALTRGEEKPNGASRSSRASS
jgi:major vault protein